MFLHLIFLFLLFLSLFLNFFFLFFLWFCLLLSCLSSFLLFLCFSLSTTLFQKKNGNISSLFSRRKICVCQFPLWEAFSKNGSFVNVFETSFFESPLCFSLCAQKNLDMIFSSLSLSFNQFSFCIFCSLL